MLFRSPRQKDAASAVDDVGVDAGKELDLVLGVDPNDPAVPDGDGLVGLVRLPESVHLGVPEHAVGRLCHTGRQGGTVIKRSLGPATRLPVVGSRPRRNALVAGPRPVGMDTEELVAAVRDGELRLHELEAHADADAAAAARRRLLTEETGADLETVGAYAFDAADAGPNVENALGAAQVPMGVVGPIRVDGGAVDGAKYLPLATTEGALVASVNRGCAAIRAADGATARVLKNAMTREIGRAHV